MPNNAQSSYRGRLAPTPTGLLHRGHARAFGVAWARARNAGGSLLYRLEDLDRDRCKAEFVEQTVRDMQWLGLNWDETTSPQSARLHSFQSVWRQLAEVGAIYPSPHSRKDVQAALSAPHEGEGEVIFPPNLRPAPDTKHPTDVPGELNWRFRVAEGEPIEFVDGHFGPQRFVAGKDFGDFLVWRRDGLPSYELAVVADDHATGITEVVRGADLLLSTARQLLLYRALGWDAPDWFHVPLVRDASGQRLAKRHASESLDTLRKNGAEAGALLAAELASVGLSHPCDLS